MLKLVIASFMLSSMSFAASSAGMSASSAKEVEMEMSAEKQIIINRAKPDAALYLFSNDKQVSQALLEAMEVVQKEVQAKYGPEAKLTVDELALQILNAK